MSVWKCAGLFILSLVGVGLFVLAMVALGLGGRWVNMKVEAWFSPREQNIQREVFENTKSYNEGKEQELVKYKFEHDKANGKGDTATMAAIKSAVRHSFGDYEEDRLSPELQDFVRQCKYGG